MYHRFVSRTAHGALAALSALCAGVATAAPASAAAPATLADVASAQASTHLIWLAMAGALVFFMQTGFALLESGMCRSKNAINVLMKNYFDMCFGAIAFLLVGYGLMYGANPSGWLGTSHFFGVGLHDHELGRLFFQMMFAATAATIVSGAIAERARFSTYIIGSVVITGLTYPIFGSWAWGSSFAGEGWLRQMGFVDFAGSTVVHVIGGFSALAAVMVVGPRTGRFGSDGRSHIIPGHNLTLVALGGLILWLGWFGFNGGSISASHEGLGKVLLNTHLAGAAGAIGAVTMMAGSRRPLLMTAAVNGGLAGLVSVTAGANVMEPFWAIVTGLAGGTLSVIATAALERHRIDDVVGAFAVHAVGGTWGTIAVALFNANDMWNLQQLGVQILGCSIAAGWAFATTWLTYTAMASTIGVRATTLNEQRGLDFAEHYEVGYPEFQHHAVNAGKA